MNIHEYQAKGILRGSGVSVQEGVHCTSIEQVGPAYDELNSEIVAIKCQIHAGGRGKGILYHPESGELILEGGVKIAKSREEVVDYAEKMLGNRLVTKQTGEGGKIVNNIYIEAGCDIEHEYYLALLIDREKKELLIMASREGGMDIEEVAESNPEAIHKLYPGLEGWGRSEKMDEIFDLGRKLGFEDDPVESKKYGFPIPGKALSEFQSTIACLLDVFITCDCAMIEINPMVKTTDDRIVLLDAKMSFDDNALFRQERIAALRDLSEEEPTEVRAKAAGLSYVKLDGNIGCLVNGAGLAMATMDVIKLYGGEPANFLDVGGGANEEQVTTAFGIIMEDANVKGILVNIFGGIMRCDIIARGVIAATQALALEDPLVVRLVGTNFEEGRRILGESGLNIHTAETLAEGAQKIVELVGGENS